MRRMSLPSPAGTERRPGPRARPGVPACPAGRPPGNASLRRRSSRPAGGRQARQGGRKRQAGRAVARYRRPGSSGGLATCDQRPEGRGRRGGHRRSPLHPPRDGPGRSPAARPPAAARARTTAPATSANSRPGGPLQGLVRDLGDPLHGPDQLLGGEHLVVGRPRDPLDEPGGVLGDLADPFERRPGLADPLGLLLHLGLLLAQGADALVGVGLDRLDERADLAGGRRRSARRACGSPRRRRRTPGRARRPGPIRSSRSGRACRSGWRSRGSARRSCRSRPSGRPAAGPCGRCVSILARSRSIPSITRVDLLEPAAGLVPGALARLGGVLGVLRDPVDLVREGLDGRGVRATVSDWSTAPEATRSLSSSSEAASRWIATAVCRIWSSTAGSPPPAPAGASLPVAASLSRGSRPRRSGPTVPNGQARPAAPWPSRAPRTRATAASKPACPIAVEAPREGCHQPGKQGAPPPGRGLAAPPAPR